MVSVSRKEMYIALGIVVVLVLSIFFLPTRNVQYSPLQAEEIITQAIGQSGQDGSGQDSCQNTEYLNNCINGCVNAYGSGCRNIWGGDHISGHTCGLSECYATCFGVAVATIKICNYITQVLSEPQPVPAGEPAP